MRQRMRMLVALLAAAAMVLDVSAPAAAADAIESDLAIAVQGAEKRISLDQALALLNVPSVSVALIDGGRVAFARAYGKDATPETLYQAASLSKFVAAIGAMRLVEQGRLKLDVDVNDALTTWHVPSNAFDETHKVTLRGLLSMTGGIGVPGFLGYKVGEPIPTLTQVLNGACGTPWPIAYMTPRLNWASGWPRSAARRYHLTASA
ncbi:MAG: serine hydrolase domain-containing protein [Methyloceanibacter sp.]